MARGKGVWLAVYVERPRRRSLSRNHHHRHHHHLHHHHHLYVHRARQLAVYGGGYNRKAQLLEYSRQLRESARSQASSPLLHPKPASHHQPMTQVVPLRNKPKLVRYGTCMNWTLLIPSLLRPLIMPRNKKEKKQKKKTNNQSTAAKMKTLMKKFQVHKNRGVVSKMFASLRKHR